MNSHRSNCLLHCNYYSTLSCIWNVRYTLSLRISLCLLETAVITYNCNNDSFKKKKIDIFNLSLNYFLFLNCTCFPFLSRWAERSISLVRSQRYRKDKTLFCLQVKGLSWDVHPVNCLVVCIGHYTHMISLIRLKFTPWRSSPY